MLTSVVSVFFYLRIVVMMWMTEGPEVVRPRIPATAAAGLALATIAVFYLGVLPTRILQLALDSILDDFLIAGPGYSAPIVIFAFAAGFALQQVRRRPARSGRSCSRSRELRPVEDFEQLHVLLGRHRPQIEHDATILNAGNDGRRRTAKPCLQLRCRHRRVAHRDQRSRER